MAHTAEMVNTTLWTTVAEGISCMKWTFTFLLSREESVCGLFRRWCPLFDVLVDSAVEELPSAPSHLLLRHSSSATHSKTLRIVSNTVIIPQLKASCLCSKHGVHLHSQNVRSSAPLIPVVNVVHRNLLPDSAVSIMSDLSLGPWTNSKLCLWPVIWQRLWLHWGFLPWGPTHTLLSSARVTSGCESAKVRSLLFLLWGL